MTEIMLEIEGVRHIICVAWFEDLVSLQVKRCLWGKPVVTTTGSASHRRLIRLVQKYAISFD